MALMMKCDPRYAINMHRGQAIFKIPGQLSICKGALIALWPERFKAFDEHAWIFMSLIGFSNLSLVPKKGSSIITTAQAARQNHASYMPACSLHSCMPMSLNAYCTTCVINVSHSTRVFYYGHVLCVGTRLFSELAYPLDNALALVCSVFHE